jgi:nicotinamide phosphoribosyltransferase
MQSPEIFAQGPVRVPWPVRGDAYTVSSKNIVSPEAKLRSVYNFTNRRSPVDGLPKGVATDGRMCLYGLTDFIQRELTVPVTALDVGISKVFMEEAHSFGGPLDFDSDMWHRVTREFNGYLPIRIEALPEGSTFWVNEPVIQVTSLDEGFGEIAAIIEAIMVGYVANATARLTLTRHLLERIRDVVRKHHPSYTPLQVDGVSQWMVHDFGMRASSTPEESEIYGRAHLLCFNGTDTFNAAFQLWATNPSMSPVGTSVLALAHRIVMGYAHEEEAYAALMDATRDSIGSYVADCYDFHGAVTNFLVSIAKQSRGITRKVVARPDSGDYLENILFVVDEAMKHDLYVINEEGKPVATYLRFIQGDSMTWEKMERAFNALESRGLDPTGWGTFGVGGWLRNTPNRDSLSSAYKLAAYGRDNTPCCKLSDTLAKVSVPGPTCVMRPHQNQKLEGPTVYLESEVATAEDRFHPECGAESNALQVFYDGGKKSVDAFSYHCLEDFNTHRERVLNEFDSFSYVKDDCGSPLSHKIQKFQTDLMKKHGKDYTY